MFSALPVAALLTVLPSSPAGKLAEVVSDARARERTLYTEYGRRLDAVTTDADREAVEAWGATAFAESVRAGGPGRKALLNVLRRSADDPTVVPGLLYLMSDLDPAVRAEAAALLFRRHPTHPDTVRAAENAWYIADAWVEPLVRSRLAAAPDDRKLRFALAMHLTTLAQWIARIRGDREGIAQMDVRFGRERVAELRRANAPKCEAEAVELFEDLARTGCALTDHAGRSLADVSRSNADELKHLGVGKKAPDIAGEDLDGVGFRLSDYKGKVVLLSFWGSRCSPCMALVPHERRLVARFAGRPFAVVGVNSDEDKEQVRPVVERNGISWRSFWCGPKGMSGDIPRAWNVSGLADGLRPRPQGGDPLQGRPWDGTRPAPRPAGPGRRGRAGEVIG